MFEYLMTILFLGHNVFLLKTICEYKDNDFKMKVIAVKPFLFFG